MAKYTILDRASDQLSAVKILEWGEVVWIDDQFEAKEIRVRIPTIDKNIDNNDDLPPCYPLISPFFHFVPQIGDRVSVLLDRLYTADKIVNQEKRYYLSISISQPQNIDGDPYYYTANSNETDGWTRREKPISQIPTARGVYPRKEDVALVGRDNADVTLRDGEVLIRAGRHEQGDYLQFNRKNPSFIQLRYGLDGASKEIKTRTITKIEQIAPDYTIKVTTDTKYRLLIKVILKRNGEVVEQFTASYTTKENLVIEGKSKIREYQEKYKKWEFRAVDDDFSDIPTIYPNNTRLVKQEVAFNENGEFEEFAGSCINVVSEKINFISSKSAGNYNTTDPDKQIDEQTQLELNSTLHPTVYGDKLLEVLNLVKDFVKSHTHPYAGMATVQDEVVKKLLNYNLDSIIDKNIRIG